MQDQTHSFGYWLRRRRKALDLTQAALAERVNCSGFTIRKIEADERRPSRTLAERLATSLAMPAQQRRAFLDSARAVRPAGGLRIDALPVAGLQPAASTVAAALGTPRDSTGHALPFVGRVPELALLDGLVAGLAGGSGRTVLIQGEPGIGKSRLLREVAQRARVFGVPALATNCYEIERGTPYQPVIQLLKSALDELSDTALRSVPPVSLAELAALVPEIGERIAGLPQLSNDFPQARQARLPGAVDQLLEASRAGRALLLMVDNIQWADDASAVVLRFLARQAATRPMLMICACRDDELDSDERLVQWVQGLCREADAQVVPLGRLGAGESGLLIAALGDVGPHAPGLAARLHRETEGNPFFLVSMMQSLAAGEMREGVAPGGDAAPLPDALRAAVRARVAHVAMQFRPTLETAAVLGRHFDFDTLLAVTGASETALLDATDALVKRHLWIEEDADGDYDFSHDKIREVVYRDLGGARRRVLHQAVAEALERRGDGDAHEQDARLAEHFDRAQVWPKALRYMIAAGQRSQALFAMRDALHWLDRALALCEAQPSAVGDGPREHQALWVRELRGAARAQAGQAQGAVDDFRLILAAARAAGRADQIGEALLRLGMACRRADAYDEATACLSEALEQSRAAHDEHHAADTLYHLGTVAWSTGRNGQAIALHQEAVDIVERAGLCDLVAVQAYHGRGEASFANAEPAAAIDGYTRSLALARAIGDKSYESENLMMIGHACLGTKGLGDYARARSTFEAALDIARAADLQWHLGPTLLGLEHVRACTGHYGAAWTGMCDTLHWLERVGQPRYQLIAFDFMAHLLLDLGLNELALAQLERALALGRDTDIMFWRVALEAHMAIARLRLGHVDAASALQGTLAQTLHTCEPYLVPRCTEALAEMALAAGDAGRCLELGDQLLALAVPNGLRESEAQARRWRGEALLAQGAPAQALAELKHGLALADQVGRVSLQRDVHGALARASVAMDQPAVAQQHRADEQTLAKAIQASLADSGLMAAARRSEATC